MEEIITYRVGDQRTETVRRETIRDGGSTYCTYIYVYVYLCCTYISILYCTVHYDEIVIVVVPCVVIIFVIA